MNKRIQTKFGPYPLIAILLCVVACTLRTVATFLGVDAFGYFEHSTLYKVSTWIIVASVVILLSLPLAYRKRRDALVEQTTPHTFLPSLMMGMLFLFFVGEGVFSLKGEYFIPTLDKITFLLALGLGLVACIYFLSLAILESTMNDRKANLGMACVLFFGIYAAYLYLNTTVPRNAHIELSEEMTFIALMLYFLYEVRISLGKQRQTLYVTFAMIGGILCSYCVIPTLIYYIASGRLLASSLTSFLLLCGTLAFILLRLALFEKSPTDAPIPLVEQLMTVAKAREEEVREVEALYAPSPIQEVEITAQEGEVRLEECENTNEEDATENAEIVIEETQTEGDAEASLDSEVSQEGETLSEREDAEVTDSVSEVIQTPEEEVDATESPSPEGIAESELPCPEENEQGEKVEGETLSTSPSEHNEPKEEENEENISN